MRNYDTKKIAIVIPAFNEAKRIEVVLESLKNFKIPFFVVDDGSKDKTFEIAQKHTKYAYRHRINLGKGAALKTGCEAAFNNGFETVIMMDADGQHQIEDLPKFIKVLEENKYDVIFGSRNLNLGMPLIRFLGNKFASALISLLFKIYISDLICGYRALTKNGYQRIRWNSTGYGVETEMVINTGKNKLTYCEVPVETVYYDKFKGVTILDALSILFNVFVWKFTK